MAAPHRDVAAATASAAVEGQRQCGRVTIAFFIAAAIAVGLGVGIARGGGSSGSTQPTGVSAPAPIVTSNRVETSLLFSRVNASALRALPTGMSDLRASIASALNIPVSSIDIYAIVDTSTSTSPGARVDMSILTSVGSSSDANTTLSSVIGSVLSGPNAASVTLGSFFSTYGAQLGITAADVTIQRVLTLTAASIVPTPTSSASATSTATSSATSTSSSTMTASSSSSGTSSGTQSRTATATSSSTATSSGTSTQSLTSTGTGSSTASSTATQSLTSTGSSTGSGTASSTATQSLTGTSSSTGSGTASSTATQSLTGTGTSSSTASSTATQSLTGSSTGSSTASSTATQSLTGSSTSSSTASSTATGSSTASSTATQSLSSTSSSTATQSMTGSSTSTSTSTSSSSSTSSGSALPPVGSVSTLAGSVPGGNGFSSAWSNGVGTSALFTSPYHITSDGVDALYLTDPSNSNIRKIVVSTRVATLVAGTGSDGAQNGASTQASFRTPFGITIDTTANVLYVSEFNNHMIRKIDLAAQMVSTVAGSAGNSGTTNGVGTAARFNAPAGLVLDGASGTLYVAEGGNHVIRQVLLSTATVSVLAGSIGSSGRVDNTGTSAKFLWPYGITYDGSANLYVADTDNHVIRKIVVSSGAVTTVAGTGAAGFVNSPSTPQFNTPWAVTLDGAGNLYVADSSNNAIRKVVVSTGVVSTLAGLGPGNSGTTDGLAAAATFNRPVGIVAGPGGTNLYVADNGNGRVRQVRAA